MNEFTASTQAEHSEHNTGMPNGVMHYTDSATCSEEQAATALENFQAGRKLRTQYPTAREAYAKFVADYSRRTFPVQVGPKVVQRYLERYDGSWEHAYRAWLRDYADKQIQPDRFRQPAQGSAAG